MTSSHISDCESGSGKNLLPAVQYPYGFHYRHKSGSSFNGNVRMTLTCTSRSIINLWLVSYQRSFDSI
ncbi:unnamed protein product [Allacma fusca]|uniref:Uncharacterized protein n=1 Tax=Allacma fusca TaxID=39272 RepID=A0A8J2PJU7_9HEXA|nr:unnamed protein product [Allacma fusca]